MKCPICKSKFDHPVRRGRRAHFCGDRCRAVHRKEWRREYDASEPVRARKRVREMKKWYRDNPAKSKHSVTGLAIAERDWKKLGREWEEQEALKKMTKNEGRLERLARLGL